MSEEIGGDFYIDEEGVLNFPVFTIHKEFFDMDIDRKRSVLIRLQQWLNTEIENL